ncbi:MAG: type II secretion system F family protein [bacterium]
MEALPFAMLVGLALFFMLAFGATVAGVFRGPARAALGAQPLAASGAAGAATTVATGANLRTRARSGWSLPSRGALIVGVTGLLTLLAFAVPPHRPIQIVAGAILGMLVSSSLARALAERRQAAFTAVLPDALDLLASAIRTGQPIRAGLDLVAREMPDPLGAEFAIVTRDIELGLGEVDALEGLAERLDSLDVQMLVTSIAVQKEVGGNLPEVLGILGQTIRARFRIQGQVQAYTAQARLSAKVLIALPVLFATILYVIRPTYLAVLVTDPAGHALLAVALGGWLIGWVVIRWILSVNV